MKNVVGTKKIIAELQRKEKEKRRAAFIYIIPFMFALLALLLFILPIIRFTNFENELTESTSVFGNLFNNIGVARRVLFSPSADKDPVYMAFARFVLISAFAALGLFAIGFVSSFCYMLTGLAFLKNADESTNLFLTFVPNRALVFILSFLCVVPSVFPKLLSLLIERFLIVYTKTDIAVVIIAVVLWHICLLSTLIIKIKTPWELDIFAKNEKKSDNDYSEYEISDAERARQASELIEKLEKSKKK